MGCVAFANPCAVRADPCLSVLFGRELSAEVLQKRGQKIQGSCGRLEEESLGLLRDDANDTRGLEAVSEYWRISNVVRSKSLCSGLQMTGALTNLGHTGLPGTYLLAGLNEVVEVAGESAVGVSVHRRVHVVAEGLKPADEGMAGG